MTPLICIYEDRPRQLPGVMLLVHSLSRFCPDAPIRLRFPDAPPEARRWLARYARVELRDEALEGKGSYNIKPNVLLDGLSQGADACLWLDTDILVNGTLAAVIEPSLETVVISQDPWEYGLGSSQRCDSFGLTRGRALAGPLNSAVVRVSRCHEPLLHAWAEILRRPEYLSEQAKPVVERVGTMLGDQDVISALLASETFAHIPLRVLKHPCEILQHHGPGAFGPRQRLAVRARGLPPLLHAMGSVKPWNMVEHPSLFGSARDYYERLYLESSPYVTMARQYRHVLEGNLHWLDPKLKVSAISLTLTRHNPIYSGAFQAAIHQLAHAFRSS